MLEHLTQEQRSYLIGFLQGDGSHYQQSGKSKGKVGIELNSCDVDILDKIENILAEHVHVGRGSRTRDTNFKNSFHASSLCVSHSDFRHDIIKYVPVGKKSVVVNPPVDVEPNHYIRGLSDADGSISFAKSIGKPIWSLCTSSDTVKDFVVNNINEVIGVEKNLRRNTRDSVYNICLQAEEAIQYCNALYEGATIYLNRKYKAYKDISLWERPEGVQKRSKVFHRWSPTELKLLLSNDLTPQEKSSLLGISVKQVYRKIYYEMKQK